MGNKAILPGLRADLVQTMIYLGISFENKVETKGMLQPTLKEYLKLKRM